MQFQRIGDSNYFYVQNSLGQDEQSIEEDIFLDLSGSGLPEADQRYISLWLAKQEKPALSSAPSLLQYKGKLFRVTAAEYTVAAQVGRAISEATNFFRNTHTGQKRIYSIEKAPDTVGHIAGLKTYRVDGAPSASISRPDIVTQESTTVRLSFQAFDDPYTNLAENAFQQGLEKSYAAHDTKETSNTSFYFDPKSRELVLVRTQDIAKVKKDKPTAVRDAVNRYRAFLSSEYGEKKVLEMEHRLGINLTKLAIDNHALTPEHVYRFNQLTLQMTLPEIETLWNTLEHISANKTDAPLVDVLQIPIFQLRAVASAVSQGKDPAQATVKELRAWVEDVRASGKQIDRVMNLFIFDTVTLDRMYTGRRIFESIASDYTTADYTKRKTYVDAQELMQASEEHFYDESRDISDQQKTDAFYERLAHIICKKELVQTDRDTTLKVGMLIPARPDSDGTNQWYVVTACTRSAYGKCTYQLEPASTASQLPRILLHRSTFTNEAPESARNDVNPLSGPGYEGYLLTAPYEDEFVNACTVPTWVGYAVWAEQGLKEDTEHSTIVKRLEKAHTELLESIKKPHLPLTYGQLIQKHDYLLLDLLYSSMWTTKVTLSDKKKLYDILSRYSKDEMGDTKQQESDIAFIKSLLNKFPTKQNEDFVQTLDNFAETLKPGFSPPDIDQIISSSKQMQELDQLRRNSVDSPEAAKAFTQALIELAKKQNEHPSQKKKQDVAIVGHSLGGAISQISMVHYTAGLGRIPLGTMQARIFDAPGIHDRDCDSFAIFGNEHQEMIKALGGKLSIVSSQEQGDPVILGGQRHLGGTKSENEEKLQNSWLSFRCELFEVTQNAKARALRDSPTAHATRFQARLSDEDVTIHTISPSEQYAHDYAEQGDDWARFQEKWKLLPNTPLSKLASRDAEALRKTLGMPLRAFRPLFLANFKEKNEFEKQMNEHGIFAITLSGIQTKKSNPKK